ncbi:MAG: hypothetical protein HUJ97_10230, partial [Bacteroidales bacterium]|nr:hypothetical protein [Bacteroidales bacterium]
LENENSELLGQADELNAILSNPQKLNEVLISELEEIKKKYGDARRTELTNIIVKKEEQIKETIKSEDVVVIINNNNEIRRVAKSSYKVQNRNGKGTKNQNIITNVIRTNTIEDLMVFTNKNKVYKLLVNDIPNGAKGDKIANLIKLENNEKVLAIAPISEEKEYIVFITKLGMIKKSYVKEYANIKKNGVIALKLKENDSLKEILFINNESLIIVSKNGKGIKFKTEDIRPIGRSAIGVKGINLDDKDEVVSCSIINNEEDYVAVFAESGNGKRVKLSELVYQVRGGKGNLISKDTVATIAIVKQEDNLLVVGETNSICIKANDIPVANRLALGAKLIKDNGIISVAKL